MSNQSPESDVLAALDLDHQQFAREGRSSLFGDAAAEIRRLRAELDRAGTDAAVRKRIEALIGGSTPPVFLSDRPNKIVRVQHRDDRLCATVTESMVKVSDIVEALSTPPATTTDECVRSASCEDGDHTYSWPCARAVCSPGEQATP